MTLTEDELDTLVTIALRRAEILDEAGSQAASEAWQEVSIYEERLAAIIAPTEIAGGIARVGAVRAALAAGQWPKAARLRSVYLGEPELPPGRRAAIELAFREDQERRAEYLPALVKSGRLKELAEWQDAMCNVPRVFPQSA
jgi:hypothetical protein